MNIQKNKLILFSIVQFFIIGIFLFIEKYKIEGPMPIDRFFIIYFALAFISLHFFVKPKKIWDFIYEKRVVIFLAILTFCVFNKYHLSSVGVWNQVVPSGEQFIKNSTPFLGTERSIRSDEWMVSTPAKLSQKYTKKPFSKYNNILMGKNSLVTLYPNLPSFSLSIIGTLMNIGYLFLDIERAFSLASIGENLFYIFITFEFFMVITDKNKKYSILGTFLVGFSAAYYWWSSINVITWGQCVVVLLNYYLNSKSNRERIIWTFLLSIAGLNYVMILYPAWQVTFGYVYLVIMLWLLFKNKEKIKKSIWISIAFCIAIILLILIPTYLENREIFNITSNTTYPGARFSTGGEGWQLLFNYYSTLFYPFVDINNPCEGTQFLSLFPLPIFISIYYIIKNFKNKKYDILLISLTILSVLLVLWNFIELPRFVAKITLLSFSTPRRSQLVVGYITCILMVLLMLKYENSKTKFDIKTVIVFFISCIILLIIGVHASKFIVNDYLTNNMILISCVIFGLLMLLLLINNKKYNNIFIAIISLCCFLTSVTVNPITKGLSVIYEKPLSKEVRKIVYEDKYAKWITINNWHLQNFIVANGASTINSTNYYPNFELWNKIDPNGEYKDIYNRYAHIIIKLTEEKTSVNLDFQDSITLNLNKDDICKIDVSYILSTDEIDNSFLNINKIYDELGMKIYKLNCGN